MSATNARKPSTDPAIKIPSSNPDMYLSGFMLGSRPELGGGGRGGAGGDGDGYKPWSGLGWCCNGPADGPGRPDDGGAAEALGGTGGKKPEVALASGIGICRSVGVGVGD